RIVRKIQDLPGQELFQYRDHDGNVHSVTSADVNAYLREISGEDFTAKDFRTWSATVMALSELSHACGFTTKREANGAIKRVMANVSAQLGNTPAICRKSYVHPAIINSYLNGSLEAYLKKRAVNPLPERNELDRSAETVVLEFLREFER